MAALATVLAEKRARAVRRAVPDLAVTPAFRERFVGWATTRALRPGGPADRADRADRPDRASVHPACQNLLLGAR